jgi:outer membrane protein assembly factor BamD
MNARLHLDFRLAGKFLAMAGLILAAAVGARAVGPNLPSAAMSDHPGGGPAAETKKKHALSWWESARASKTTPAKQLAYADSLRDQGRLIFASKQYRALTYAWPQSPEAPQAQYRFAQLLERRGKDLYAFEEYQYLIEAYAGFVPYEEVLERQYGIADRIATNVSRILLFTFRAPEEAIPLFETLIQNGPHWKRAPELQFRIARIYEKKEQYDLAMDAYSLYQQKYPISALAEQAAFGHGSCAYKYATEHPNAADLRQNAEGVLLGFLERYPRSAMAPAARASLNELQQTQAAALYRQAKIYDRQAQGDPRDQETRTAIAAARVCYQRVVDEYPLSQLADTARAKINALNQKMEPGHEKQ